MKIINEHRLSTLLCILFFLIGVLVCQIDYEKWSPKSSPDLAAWVQAAGALLGIAIAIAVPAWQRRHERKAKRMDALDGAELAAHQVISSIRMVASGMKALHKRGLEDVSGDFNRDFIKLFKESMAYSTRPSDEQLLRLLPIDGAPAYKVVEAYCWMERLLYLYSFDSGEPLDSDTIRTLVKDSLPKLNYYNQLLADASKDLENFLDSRKNKSEAALREK